MDRKLEQLTLKDAFMLSKVMKNYKLARRLLETLTGYKIKNILHPKNTIVTRDDGMQGIRLEMHVFDEKTKVQFVNLFIYTEDIFGEGRSVYLFEERCVEIPELTLEHGERRVFVCATSQTAEQEANENVKALLYYIMNPKDKRNNFARMLDDEVRRVQHNSLYKKEYQRLLQEKTEENQRIYARSRCKSNIGAYDNQPYQ